MSKYTKYIVQALEKVGARPSIQEVYLNTQFENLIDWMNKQVAIVAGTGVTTAAIPGLHLSTIVADLAVLFNRAYVGTYGIGAIIGYQEISDNILEEEDFTVVLARWCGVDGVSNAALSKTAATLTKIGGKVATKVLAKTACQQTGILVGQKIGGKLGAKLGSKLGAKIGGKALGGFIPIIGSAISGGINAWFITEICKEAKKYYQFKATL